MRRKNGDSIDHPRKRNARHSPDHQIGKIGRGVLEHFQDIEMVTSHMDYNTRNSETFSDFDDDRARGARPTPKVEVSQRAVPPKKVTPPTPRPPDKQRFEDFYRRHLQLKEIGCDQNECAQNKEYDPFCLCRLENRRPKTPQNESRILGTPAGLRNLSNTCYMNSYLQTLFHILPIRRALYEWRMPPLERHTVGKNYNVVQGLQDLFSRLQSTDKKSVSPKDFVKSAGINAALQQDAQEFSVLFLEWIDTCLAEREGDEKLRSLFKGRLRSTIKCRKCRNESSGDSDFYDFSLQTNEIDDVMNSLMLYFAGEQIDEYACEICAQRQIADKQLQMIELPRFLNLHLLRFYFDRKSCQQRKLTHAVHFLPILDLRPFLTEEQICEWGEDGCRYELIAVLIHWGDAKGGHYIARIRISNGRWYTFNDDMVSPYNTDGLKNDANNAYMLVYERRRDIERNPRLPNTPERTDIRENEVGAGLEQLQNLQRTYGDLTLYQFLRQLKSKPNALIIWLPTDWLCEVLKKLQLHADFIEKFLSGPEMKDFLCEHGSLGKFDRLKGIDAKQAEKLLDVMEVVPSPYYVDGSKFCEECAQMWNDLKKLEKQPGYWL